ncbi:N-acetylglucosamine kinase [Stackebrandtia soli]|uniref:N-acetylglucosamine kinase n=1 Tax=Stackebrandtia soli TaxID=1892856 RepID=UPI0039EAB449
MFSPNDLLVGLDVGGTSTRIVVADRSGRRLGAGAAGGGNPISRGRDVAVANVRDAMDQAMAGLDASSVAGVVMGIAGARSAQAHDGERIFDPVWRAYGIDADVRMVGDPLVAFAAGSSAGDGTVLIAGTGAVAAQVTDFDLSGTRDDGYGWLLGDTGSGFWLGRQAVNRTLRHINGHEPAGPLTASVLSALSVSGASVEAVIGRVMADAPIRLAEYAPLVTSAAIQGDPTAKLIIAEAVELLCQKMIAVRAPGESTPIVLAGSLAAGDTPIADGIRSALAVAFPEAPVHAASDGAAGAAWLAARMVSDDEAELAAMHRALLG